MATKPDENGILAVAPAPAPAPAVPPAANGFDFSKSAGVMAQPADYKPSSDALTSERLNKLLSQDSEYMQLAKTKALQSMNSRGLMNSSMAVGAGQAAAIEAARPIAEADANAFMTAERDNAANKNEFAKQQNAFGREASTLQYRGILDAENQQRDIAFRQQEADKDRTFRAEQMQAEYKLQNANVPVQFATGVAQQLQASVTQITTDPNLSPEAKRNAITNLVGYSNATMEWAERFYGGTFSRFAPNDITLPSSQPAAAPAPVAAPAAAPAPVRRAPAPQPVLATGGDNWWEQGGTGGY